MKVLVSGDENQFQQISRKFESSDLTHNQSGLDDFDLNEYQVVFDFQNDDGVNNLNLYNSYPNLTVFCNSIFTRLRDLIARIDDPIQYQIIGFNGLNTFVERALLELTIVSDNDSAAVKSICNALETEYLLVEDKPGMVSPRVVCMIINEAYFTLEEGTAERDAIDAAMKLGTNYPIGPFEWSQRIGLKSVVKLLESVFEETNDVRYEICPLLREEATKS